ncbi:B-cell receptor CD22-like [Misgurnus anguillicaudatus]|uniref:B-cell receptor CD22-like n=1 Tax=Misgurnus anguillicaudatus TaxID=75329 RepID=UPI003CCFB881
MCERFDMEMCFRISLMFLLMTADLQVETNQKVKEGDTVTLTCKTTCRLTEETTFIWYRDTQIFTKGIKTLNQLHLHSVSRDDSGVYRCDAAALRGSERLSSPDVYLNVEWVSQQDWVNYSPPYVCALRGSTVRITCRPTLKYPSDHVIDKAFWTKVAHKTDGEPPDLCLDPENRGVQCHSEKKDTYIITLTNVTETDKHIYYCRFITDKTGGKWTGTPGARLDVTDLQVETNQKVKEGDTVTLTCKTTCSLSEETTFIWYRNTKRFTKGIIILNQLHMQSVSRDDSGVYRCAAAVRGSKRLLSSPDVYLNVEYPPEKTSVSISGSGEIMEGDSVNLICSSESNPPVQIYSWFKGGEFIGSGQIYSIKSIRSDHNGEYKCKSSNKHGEKDSDAVMLNVMYAPRNVVVSISGSGEIMEGDSVNLTCRSESNPPAQIYSWFKKNETSSVGSGQTYSITNINSSNSGWFYCEAQNEVGSQRSSAISVTVTGVHNFALYTLYGILAGCGALIFIIIFIILFMLSVTFYISSVVFMDSVYRLLCF